MAFEGEGDETSPLEKHFNCKRVSEDFEGLKQRAPFTWTQKLHLEELKVHVRYFLKGATGGFGGF